MNERTNAPENSVKGKGIVVDREGSNGSTQLGDIGARMSRSAGEWQVLVMGNYLGVQSIGEQPDAIVAVGGTNEAAVSALHGQQIVYDEVEGKLDGVHIEVVTDLVPKIVHEGEVQQASDKQLLIVGQQLAVVGQTASINNIGLDSSAAELSLHDGEDDALEGDMRELKSSCLLLQVTNL